MSSRRGLPGTAEGGGFAAAHFLVRRAVVLMACGTAGALPSAALAGSSQAPNWAKQAPAAHPPTVNDAPMVYDAATGTVVLFSGLGARARNLGDTWTWG